MFTVYGYKKKGTIECGCYIVKDIPYFYLEVVSIIHSFSCTVKIVGHGVPWNADFSEKYSISLNSYLGCLIVIYSKSYWQLGQYDYCGIRIPRNLCTCIVTEKKCVTAVLVLWFNSIT